jgi:hypothetical protein
MTMLCWRRLERTLTFTLTRRRRHWAPDGRRKGAPRVYEFSGAHEQLQTVPSKLPQCPYFYATQEVFGNMTPDLGGDAIGQWFSMAISCRIPHVDSGRFRCTEPTGLAQVAFIWRTGSRWPVLIKVCFPTSSVTRKMLMVLSL